MGPSAGAGVVLVSPEGGRFRYVIRIHFPASNNIAEYEALVNGLHITIDLGATRLYVYGDSKLAADQVMKNANCENSLMDAYCQEVRKLEGKFRGLELHHILRNDNGEADVLTKMAANRHQAPDGVFVNDLKLPSVREKPPIAPKTPVATEGPAPSAPPPPTSRSGANKVSTS